MTHTEEWRPVVGYEGLYEVSRNGGVRNVQTGYVKMQTIDKRKGYAAVMLSGRCRERRALVHRLVAFAFLPPPTPGQTDVCHNNGNPSDNRLENLRWDTHAGNMADIRRHGTGRGRLSGLTHCQRGHEFTPENTGIGSKGGRICRACNRAYQRARYHQRKSTPA